MTTAQNFYWFLCYGLFGGPPPWGGSYSLGMDTLGLKIAKLDPRMIVRPTFGFTETARIVSLIQLLPRDALIGLAGHSMGVHTICDVAKQIAPRRVALLAGFDATIWAPLTELGSNVDRAVSIQGTNIFSLVGHKPLTPGPLFRGKIEYFKTSLRHELLDDDPALEGLIVSRAKECLPPAAALAA